MLIIVRLTGSTLFEILTLPVIVRNPGPSSANLCEVHDHV